MIIHLPPQLEDALREQAGRQGIAPEILALDVLRNQLATLRAAGLHPGAIQPAPDFDDPLPDEFWTG